MTKSETKPKKVAVEYITVREYVVNITVLQEDEESRQSQEVFQIAQREERSEMEMGQKHEDFDLEKAARLARLEEREQRLSRRKVIFAFVSILLGVAFLFSVVMVVGTALDVFDLSDKVLIFLIGSIIAEPVGAYLLIAKYYYRD